jgi:hypothetical protein
MKLRRDCRLTVAASYLKSAYIAACFALTYGPECMRTLSTGDLLGGRSAPRAEMPVEEETQLSIKETGTN